MWLPLVRMAEKASITLALDNVFDDEPAVLDKLLKRN